MELISTDDSYADRRQLFKDIWDTAMLMEDKDPDNANKPKVIKTLRLDDDDKYVVGKKKKERIKNLRTVCNKILDYCDRQDADEVFYEQMTGVHDPMHHNLNVKPKKLKTHHKKKKITKTKSLHIPASRNMNAKPEITSTIKPTMSDRKDDLVTTTALPTVKTTTNTTPFKYTKTSIIRKALVTNYNVKVKPAIPKTQDSIQSKTRTISNLPRIPRRKVIKKKRSKRKKPKDSSDTIDEPDEWDKLENSKS